jgi:ATP-binding cassette subfamily C (CFTR/MRP) protein 4
MQAYYTFFSSARWLGFRLDMMTVLFLAISTYVLTATASPANAGLVGLSLSYLLTLTGMFQWCTRQSAEVDNHMTSVERLIEYTLLPPEAAEVTDIRPPVNWPERGEIVARNMSLEYPTRAGADAHKVLKSLDFTFVSGEKVGIVGRTGAGKSSMLTALFRLVEPTPAGCLFIDGVDLSVIGLADLRSKLSIIPQEPFLFKSSVRYNLDPFEVCIPLLTNHQHGHCKS